MGAQANFRPSTPNQTRRSASRLEVRNSDAIRVKLLSTSGYSVLGKTFDLNPFGASIEIPFSEFRNLTSNNVEVTFLLPDQIEVKFYAEIRWTLNVNNRTKLGVQFKEQLSPVPSHNPDDLSNESIELNHLHISGFFYKPYLFFERSPIEIIRILNNKVELHIPDSEVILFKGQKVEIWFIGAHESLTVEILNISMNEKKEPIVLCSFEILPQTVSTWLCHQLIYIGNYSPIELKKIGLQIDKISNGFRFRFVKTNEEYQEVLKLRYKAYLEAGKIDSQKSFLDMATPLDSKSRILICYHGVKIIASVAIAFPNETDILDTERAFSNGYPQPIPPKNELVEIARLCTDSDYRRTDLLTRMFEYTYKVTICGNRHFILTSTDEKLWPIYKKLGFKKTGMHYPHPYLAGIRHEIILGKRIQPDHGKEVSPLAWNFLWRDMNLFLDQRGHIKKSLITKIKLSIFITIGKLLRIQTNRYY